MTVSVHQVGDTSTWIIWRDFKAHARDYLSQVCSALGTKRIAKQP